MGYAVRMAWNIIREIPGSLSVRPDTERYKEHAPKSAEEMAKKNWRLTGERLKGAMEKIELELK